MPLHRCCLKRCLQPGVRLCCLIEFCWRGHQSSSDKILPSLSSTSTVTAAWLHLHSYLQQKLNLLVIVDTILCCLSLCLQGGPKPLGRAFAEPQFKTVDQLYKKCHLRFYDVNMGNIRMGELLASFELIELDYSFGEVRSVCPIVHYCCVGALVFH